MDNRVHIQYASYAKGVHLQLVSARVCYIFFRCENIMLRLHLFMGVMTYALPENGCI